METSNGIFPKTFGKVIVTLSSHIYPSSRPAKVNMWRKAIMIWFDLLSHVKEMEPMETHHTNIQH